MNSIKTAILVTLTFFALSATALPQTTYIITAPGAMPSKTAETVLKAAVQLLDEGKSGDEVRIYDGWHGQLFGSFTIPKTTSRKTRRKRTRAEMATIVRALSATSSVRDVPPNQLRFPAFTKVVGASLRSGTGDVRVICFGGPYYKDSRDKTFTFDNGSYPSDGHILAAASTSIFGTKGKKNALAGCTIHYCTLDNFTGGLDAAAVTRFWHLYVAEQGGVLSSFAASADDVVKRAMSGVSDPVSTEKIDRTDTKVEMRKVGAKEAPKEQPKPKAVPEKKSAPSHAPHLFIHIDGSASMGEELSDTVSMVKAAVTTGASVCGEIKVGLIVYRGPGETDVLPLTTVRRQSTAEPDKGMGMFLHFLDAKEVRVPDADSPDGFKMVSRMHPRNGVVDVASAVRTGIALMSGSAAQDAPCLVVFCGDQGPFELHDSSAVDAEEELVAAALHTELRGFLAKYKKAEVLSVFSGTSGRANAAKSADFFRGLAEAGGKRGKFAQQASALLPQSLALFNGRSE